MGDVDDGQSVEAQDHPIVGPRARFIGSTVAHQVRRAGHRIDDFGCDGPARFTQQSYESAHRRQVCQAAVKRIRQVVRARLVGVVYAA
ncbi:hypothetical protein MTOK_55150 [Mycolicibacterium tokaiense]|nr:hypothetical protein MTOK_55150 [Mycolicibacterium tokaiense]